MSRVKVIYYCYLRFQMSLYIGHLSARTRRDDIERVFRRFGQCDVRLKDGYGFVVYGFSPNAEKALRALQGRNICGQQLTITWSNKQPRAYQRHARSARSYESRGRDFGGRKILNDWGDYRSGIRQPDSDGGRLNSEDMLDEGRDYHQEDRIDYIGEERDNFREDLPRDGGDIVPEMVDNGRWGEQMDDPLNDNGVDNDMEFDRYEPYQGYDRKDKDVNRYQDNVGREQDGDAFLNRPNDSKSQTSCYACGALGHKMRDCPKKHSSRRKFTRFDRGPEDDNSKDRGDGELERFGSKSWENVQSSRGTKLRQRNDRWASDSGKLQMSQKNRNFPETDRVQGTDQGGNKRNKRETGSPKRHSAKKSRRSASTSFHSEYPASRSHSVSKSSKSLARSISQTRSRSISGARSLSSTSRSSSKSGYSKSLNSKSRSRSSSPTSLSLSVSLGRPTSSLNKAQLNPKESLDNGKTPESKDIQVQQAIKGDAYFENAQIETGMAAVNSVDAASPTKVEDDMGKNNHLQKDGNIMSRSSFKVTSLGNSLPEEGALATGPSPPEVLKEILDQTNSDALVIEPTDISDSETPNARSGRSTSISLEEMCMVLKHYGLELPQESEKHPSLESYFGSARLWPWESIYYRRMKKGPISVENYARRVAQNREFGIVDKYIRSSSGWGEACQDNP